VRVADLHRHVDERLPVVPHLGVNVMSTAFGRVS
jgi:hypothetical protein